MTEGRGRWLVYSGAAFDIWLPDRGNHFASVDADEITEHLHAKRLRQHKISSSAFSVLPSEVVEDVSTLPCYRPRIAFRDVTKQDNTRTIIASLVPGEVVLTHKAPYLLFVKGTARDEAYLLGLLSSMILDWYARRVVDISLTFHLLNNFPIPEPDGDDPVAARVVTIAGRLAAVDDRYAEWAAKVGVEVGTVTDKATREDLVCELDACAAHLYGLDEEDIGVIYETFHTGTDYSDRRERVLGHFRNTPTVDAVQDGATVA